MVSPAILLRFPDSFSWRESEQSEIRIEAVEPEVFRCFLVFLYTKVGAIFSSFLPFLVTNGGDGLSDSLPATRFIHYTRVLSETIESGRTVSLDLFEECIAGLLCCISVLPYPFCDLSGRL